MVIRSRWLASTAAVTQHFKKCCRLQALRYASSHFSASRAVIRSGGPLHSVEYQNSAGFLPLKRRVRHVLADEMSNSFNLTCKPMMIQGSCAGIPYKSLPDLPDFIFRLRLRGLMNKLSGTAANPVYGRCAPQAMRNKLHGWVRCSEKLSRVPDTVIQP